MALLRPTCEDLFFLRFLLDLPRDQADRYIVEKARLEISDGLLAQEQFFPRMREQFGRTGDAPDLIAVPAALYVTWFAAIGKSGYDQRRTSVLTRR